MRTPTRITTTIVLTACAGLLAAACSPDPDPAATEPAGSSPGTSTATGGHGYVEGAAETTEAQARLSVVATDGSAQLLDLLTGELQELGPFGPASAVASDGRFVYVTSPGSVQVVDSGAWTVDHGDHAHYYLAPVAALGEVAGSGAGAIASSTDATAIFFEDEGAAVVLDRDALADGEVTELLRIKTGPHRGVVVPYEDAYLASTPGADGAADGVQVLDAGGTPVEGAEAACPALAGYLVTRAGVLFGCADGVLLAAADDAGAIVLTVLAYPADLPEGVRASAFANRPGRPQAAAVAGEAGALLVDAREQSVTFVPSSAPLLAASAAGDADGTIVAVDTSGRLLVLRAAEGSEVAGETVVAQSAADVAARDLVSVHVDASRAYVNGPAEGTIVEVDYRDDARVARTFTPDAVPAFVAETGR